MGIIDGLPSHSSHTQWWKSREITSDGNDIPSRLIIDTPWGGQDFSAQLWGGKNVLRDGQGGRVVRKQRRTAISPATQLTCAVYFFVRSKKYSSISSKQGKKIKYWQLYAKMTTKWIFSQNFLAPDPPSKGCELPPITSLFDKILKIKRCAAYFN